MLEQVISLIVKFCTIGGGLWTVFGVIQLGTALKDKNGPDIKAALWTIVGGGLIIAGAVLFNSVAT